MCAMMNYFPNYLWCSAIIRLAPRGSVTMIFIEGGVYSISRSAEVVYYCHWSGRWCFSITQEKASRIYIHRQSTWCFYQNKSLLSCCVVESTKGIPSAHWFCPRIYGLTNFSPIHLLYFLSSYCDMYTFKRWMRLFLVLDSKLSILLGWGTEGRAPQCRILGWLNSTH